MRIVIIGGHGKVARLTIPILRARGDEVTAVVRNPAHEADLVSDGASEVLVADVESLDVGGIARLLAGHDAVVWSAGAGGGNPARTAAVDRDAAIRSMDAAAEAGARRYVMVSYFGAGPDHGVDPGSSFYAYAEAKAAADAQLRSSGLDWTILGPSALTDEAGSGTISVSDPEGSTVPRADVAAVIAAALHTPATIGTTIRFNAGTVPIGDALAA